MKNQIFNVTLVEDKPFPIVSIRRNKKEISPELLPKRVAQFMDVTRENSEVWRCAIDISLPDLAKRFREHSFKGDVTVRNGRRVRNNRLVFNLIYTPKPPDPKEVPELACMEGHHDGAHCGLTDWYPEIEECIRTALSSQGPWTTGWYSSKKELATARITYADGQLLIEASVSDDFDTEGRGSRVIAYRPGKRNATKALAILPKLLFEAWDDAEDDQKGNRDWEMWSVIDTKKKRLADTFLRDRSDFGLDSPPGDNYHEWGWQENGYGGLTKVAKRFFEEAFLASTDPEKPITYKKWTAKQVG